MPEASARLEELRRLLYRADVSQEERDEYARLLGEQARGEQPKHRDEGPNVVDSATRSEAAQPESTSEPSVRSVGVRRRRWLPIAGLAGVAVVVTAIGVSVWAPTAEPVTSRSRAVPQVVPFESPQPNVNEGLFSEPTAAPPSTSIPLSLDGTSVAAKRTQGRDSAVVPMARPAAPGGNHVFVSLTSTDSHPIGWTLERRALRRDHPPENQVVAGSAASLRGKAVPTIVEYQGAAPTRIVVRAAAGVHWTVDVAFVSNEVAGRR